MTCQQRQSAVAGRSPSTTVSRIAPPRSSSKSKSTSAAAEKLPSVEQAKSTGERLSNYARGPVPPTPGRRQPQAPSPGDVVPAAASGWTSAAAGASSPGPSGRPRQSARCLCGSATTPATMDTLVEEPSESTADRDQPQTTHVTNVSSRFYSCHVFYVLKIFEHLYFKKVGISVTKNCIFIKIFLRLKCHVGRN